MTASSAASGHGVEGLLDGFAVVVGEGAEHGLADGGADGVVIEVGGGVVPFGAHGCAEEAVAGFFEGGEGVFDVAFEGRVCGFEEDEIVEAGVDLECSGLGAFDVRGLDFGATAHEGGGVGFVVDGEALPERAFDADCGGGDLWIATEEEVG